MRQKIGLLITLVSVMILTFSVGMMIEGAGGSEPEETPPTRDALHSSAYASGLNSHYIGSNVEFRIVVNEQYGGEEWKGDAYSYLHDDLYYVKLSVMPDQVTNSDGKLQSTLISPLEAESLTPYNGLNNRGFNITSNWIYYSNEENDWFSLFIKAEGVKEGYYYLPVQITGRIQVDYSSTDPSGYTWMTFTDTVNIQFFVRSYVDGVSDAMSIGGYETDYCPIYAGADYLTFMGSYVGPDSSNLENFELELSLPDEYFYIANSVIKKDMFTSSFTPLWKVDISEFTPPGNYYGQIRLRYYVGELFVYEGPYNISFSVAATPLLMGPDTMDMTAPTYILTQKTMEEEISVQFTNIGNVPLVSAKVKLDLDSSMFLSQKQFYYDEDNNARKVYPPLEFETEDIAEGEVFTATFPAISVARMLPPGDYLVPFDYEITYIDPSDESNAGIRITSYQWDEMNIEDYMEMMWYRSDPRPTDLKRPHLMLRVLDADDIPEFETEMDEVLETGDRGNFVTFRISNREFYDITDANIRIWSSDPSLVSNPNSPTGPALLAELEGVRIGSSDFYSEGYINLNSRLDVSKEASSGLFEIYTSIEGFNDKMEFIEGNRSSFIQIKAEPGRLDIAALSTSEVKPGSDFTLTLTLINNGDVAVGDYQVMISCHDNMIGVKEPLNSGSDLGPGETVTLQFKCKASECMDYEMSSNLFVLTKLSDEEGNQFDFSDSDGMPVSIMAAREPEELHTTNAIKSTALYFFLAVLFASIILCLTILVSIILFLKAKYGNIIGSGEKKVKEPEPPKEKKIEEKKEEKQVVSRPLYQAPKPGPAAPQQQMQAPPVQQPPLQPADNDLMKAPVADQPLQQQEQQTPPAKGPIDPEEELSGIFEDKSKIDDLFT